LTKKILNTPNKEMQDAKVTKQDKEEEEIKTYRIQMLMN